MKQISSFRKTASLLLCCFAAMIFLVGCDGESITDGGGGGGCVGANCVGVGPRPRPGEPRLSVSVVPADGENTLTFTPPAGNNATLFNVYWSISPEVTEATWTKIEGVASPFVHDVTQAGLSNGTPIFYIATIASGSDESAASTVIGGMPGKWTPLTPSGSLPPARDSHTAVYNSTTDRMIVFGGKDQNGTFQDLRVLSGATGNPTWTMPTTNLPPESRASHTAVYNGQKNSMVVFGGSVDTAGSILRNDVWLLSNADANGVTPAWQLLSPDGFLPSARWGHAAVYDEEEDLMIVFGGVQTGAAIFNDVWVLERATTQFTSAWRQITLPVTGGPSARCCMAVGYDSANRRMIVFGGFGGFSQANPIHFGDLWTLTFDATFQTATWKELTPSGGTPPSARCCAASVWDGSKFLLFGGGTFNSSSDNKIYALVLQETTFGSADGPAGGLPARTFPTAVPAGRFLLFGGSASFTPFNDLWRLE